MRILKPRAEIIDIPGSYDEQMLSIIECTGRICYGSQDKIAPGSAQPFVNGLINRGHLAPLEHGSVYMTLPYETDYDYEAVQFYKENPYSIVKADADRKEAYVSTNYRVIIENSRGSDYVYRHGFIDNGNFERRVLVLFTEPLGIAREFNRHRTHSICEESTRFCVSGDMVIVVNGVAMKVRELYEKFTEKIGPGPFMTETLNEEDHNIIERREIRGIFETGHKECLCITTADRAMVILTQDHEVMTSTGDFVKAGDLKIGSHLYHKGVVDTVVTSIDVVRDIDCYEIEMDGNHNFFIDGLCLHNCNYSSGKQGAEVKVIEPLKFRENDDTDFNRLSARVSRQQLFKEQIESLSLYHPDNIHQSWTAADYWFFAQFAAEFAYNGLIQHCGWAPQDARDCLTLGTMTRSYHTDFVCNWKHFFNMRAFKSKSNSPHPQAIELAAPLMEEFISRDYIKREEFKQNK